MEEKDDERIRKKVKRMRNFYSNVLTFVVVNLILLAINLVTSPRGLWFYWVTIVWGIILILQAINTFTIKNPLLGDEWEEKKIQELKRKGKKK